MLVLDCLCQLGIATTAIIEKIVKNFFFRISFPRFEFAKEMYWYLLWLECLCLQKIFMLISYSMR